MSQDEVERNARKAGMTPREYCLKEISEWKEMLDHVSDDFGGLDDDEFHEQVERQVDSYRRE
ncbi:hypothetical protein [Natranaeroarchaeum aerophilus]|uniref:Uncharacterized protein n=1 Tax=Natranaeroarchaeum aerophilus TaxID=2917711 RepID=A0AAE3FRS2_9EURY|nr:hypothetical protein [Natranaeroarchaeum aerophilus]MCL9814412.1 hypothetical protein [Natranaeroarchaeum aerophilus]